MKWDSGTSNSHFTPSHPFSLSIFRIKSSLIHVRAGFDVSALLNFCSAFDWRSFSSRENSSVLRYRLMTLCLKYRRMFGRPNPLHRLGVRVWVEDRAWITMHREMAIIKFLEPGRYMQREGAAFQRRPGVRCSACSQGCWSKVDWQGRDLQL